MSVDRDQLLVCHHLDCQDLNNKTPLYLCESCDSRCHPDDTDNMHFDRHPRFDLQPQGSILARNVSTRSCPPRTSPPSDLEEEDEGGSEHGERKAAGMKVVKKKPRRRHTDDPSKECFSLKFDLSVDINTEIVPAMKKKTLREVLGPVFERKGIELSRIDLFLDQSNTPLSLNFEAYRFGGHYLKVKARPGDELKVEQGVKDLRSLSLPNMKPSEGPGPGSEGAEHQDSVDLLGQARRRKNMTEFLGDANIPSADSLSQLTGSLPSVGPGAGPGPDSWKNRAASRFSGFFSSGGAAGAFGKEVDPVEQLQNKLQSYSLFGLPRVALCFHQDSWEDEEDDMSLEDGWQQLLDNPEACVTRREFHQQEALWELLQTEATYIQKLRVITDLFLCGLLTLQEGGVLTEVAPSRLFSNIQDLVRLHTALWNQVMLPALENARQNRTLLNPTDLQHGFRMFGSRFQPYIRYCMEEEGCLEYMRSLLRENELFRIFVTWAESHKQCNRLKLADMLAKPHQRLTKYPLLLKRVLKKTEEASARDSVSSMVGCVEDFINSVDSQMRQRQEQQKLAATSGRIESYEAVEGSSEEVERILREFNRFDLMAPMSGTSLEETRQLHLEGGLRMKEGKDSKMDVYCFLFTDLLLITKPVKRLEKVKVIRQPLFIHNVVCKELKDPGSFILIYLNEFKCAVAAYTLQANSATQGRSWIDAICNVQNQVQRLRTEEVLRQQVSLQRRVEGDEEEDEDESSNSTTSSSPCLQHKYQQNMSHSDGSTETLSVTLFKESDEVQDSGGPTERDPGSGAATPQTLRSQSASPPGAQPDLCPGREQDSAYGTVSPEPLLDLPTRPGPGGEEEEEEEEEEEGEKEALLDDIADVELVEEEEEEEDAASFGSQLSVAPCLKPRRRPPVQPRLHGLQTPASLALKSRSEDNLLQRCHGNAPLARTRTHPPGDQSEGRKAENAKPLLVHSKSLSDLGEAGVGALPGAAERAEERLNRSMPSVTLGATLRRAEGRQEHRALAAACEASGCRANGGGETEAAPASPEGRDEVALSGGSEESPPKSRKSPVQQHKKLTLAQLYRIRTTLVLNSTLTASEV